jgi:hypothetical protein
VQVIVVVVAMQLGSVTHLVVSAALELAGMTAAVSASSIVTSSLIPMVPPFLEAKRLLCVLA